MTSDVGSEGRGPLCTAPGGGLAARRASSSIPVDPGHFSDQAVLRRRREAAIMPIWSVPKACPNEMARTVF